MERTGGTAGSDALTRLHGDALVSGEPHVYAGADALVRLVPVTDLIG